MQVQALSGVPVQLLKFNQMEGKAFQMDEEGTLLKTVREFEGSLGDNNFTVTAEWNPGDGDWFIEDIMLDNYSEDDAAEITKKFYEIMN
jgi:hypothetical protein